MIQLIKQIITLIVNFKMIKETLGFGIHLVGSLFTSLTNYLIRNNINMEENHMLADV